MMHTVSTQHHAMLAVSETVDALVREDPLIDSDTAPLLWPVCLLYITESLDCEEREELVMFAAIALHCISPASIQGWALNTLLRQRTVS